MVRHFCEVYDNITLFCYSRNYNNVKYMYRDLKNLDIFYFDTETEIINFIISNGLNANLIRVGFEKLDQYLKQMTFDRAFYAIAGLDFDIRFNKFYVERDFEQENNLLNHLNPNKEKYIFIHDDPSRGYNINIESNFKIIRNDLNYKFFDYLKVLENAEEVHYMQSSFADLINSYKLKHPKLFLHKKVRNYDDTIHSVGLNKVTLVN